MEVTITNPGCDPHIIDVDVEPPKRPVDAHRYATFNFSCDTDEPIQPYSHIKLTDRGKVHFRGYVYYFKPVHSIDRFGLLRTKLNVQCRGEEELMMRRFSPRHGWQAAGGPTINNATIYLTHVFEDAAPSQSPDGYGVAHNSGAFFLMNSYIPPFKWTLYDAGRFIWKLPGWGLNSRIGNANLYLEGLLLPRQSNYTDCQNTENSCYSDATDLYINIDQTAYVACYNLHLSAYNGFDTGVRRGQIDKANTPLTGNLQVNNNRWADMLINLAEFYSLTVHWRYTDSYTRFDAVDES